MGHYVLNVGSVSFPIPFENPVVLFFPVAISDQFCPGDCAQVMTTNPKPNKALKVRLWWEPD